ncbi:hypothetical protein CS022_08670 [Veronia nyctiphanis]|uniref:Uncharacterized protein n=1 Tax=Veronia nyctiphanis TaxID=1278244 RepID=A0A4V1LT10_9GAMM|nr:hypothetical protein CS022_08670 [Veronia nyctiphanis]
MNIEDITNVAVREDYLQKRSALADASKLNAYTVNERKSFNVKLVTDEEKSNVDDVLRQFSMSRHTATTFFVSRYEGKLAINSFFVDELSRFINQILIDKQKTVTLTLESLYHEQLAKLIRAATKKGAIRVKMDLELMVGIFQVTRKKTKVVVKTLEDFASFEERRKFVQDARSMGQFIAIKSQICPVDNLLLHLTGPEFDELVVTSSNKIRDLEEELEKIVVMGELYDTTDEVYLRYT